MWEEVGKPIVDALFQGFNGCLLAYGQTGSGKTHTMMGPAGAVELDEATSGLIPRAVSAIFDTALSADADAEFRIKVGRERSRTQQCARDNRSLRRGARSRTAVACSSAQPPATCTHKSGDRDDPFAKCCALGHTAALALGLAQVSFVEIYQERIRDLLSQAPGSDNLQVRHCSRRAACRINMCCATLHNTCDHSNICLS